MNLSSVLSLQDFKKIVLENYIYLVDEPTKFNKPSATRPAHI